jgi:hypothetical protein
MRAGLRRTAIAAAAVVAIAGTAWSIPHEAYARGGYRGGHWGGGGGRWHGGGRYWGGGWGGFGAGLATGAIVGGLLASPYYYGAPYYYAPRYYYEPDDEVDYCLRRYRSYDPRSGTYLGYDGYRHPCP